MSRVSAEVLSVGPDSDDELRETAFVAGPGLSGVGVRARRMVAGSDIDEWPSGFDKLASRPDGQSLDWVSTQSVGERLDDPDDMQGVTTDANNWYFTTTKRIIKIPFDRDLGENLFEDEPFALIEGEVRHTPSGIRYREIHGALFDDGLVHNGDLDCFDGVLYVPMEMRGRAPVAIAAYDAATLDFIALGQLDEDDERASACAVNPRTGLLYSAVRTAGRRRIRVDEPELDAAAGTFELRTVGELTLLSDWPVPFASPPPAPNFANHALQGMAFSRAGHLYLAKDEGENRGVHAFDVDVLRGVRGPFFFPLAGRGEFNEYELEGVAVHDMSGGQSPGIGGQVHVGEAEHWDSEYFTLHHWGVAHDSESGLV